MDTRQAMSPTSRLSPQHLDRYFSRIGYTGSRAPTTSTLHAIHRAHLLAIPYENLDIHLGRPISLDPDAMFEKLVNARRGGWCYEMNGVLGRVLHTMGFDVRHVAGAVGRQDHGDAALDNHLVLVVTLDRRWLVDVGFGDGFLEPLPLDPGTYRQGFLEYRISCDGEWWRLHNHEFGGADGFEFTLDPRALETFAAGCHELQTSPASSFVKCSVCERFEPGGLVTLRSATLRTATPSGVTTDVIEDAGIYARVLRDRFDLEIPGVEVLWRTAWAQHLAWLAGRAASM